MSTPYVSQVVRKSVKDFLKHIEHIERHVEHIERYMGHIGRAFFPT